MPFKRILCPVDFSEHAREAMRAAMALAGADAWVTLVHVHELPVIGPPELPMDPRLVAQIIAQAEKSLRAWAGEAAQLGPARVESLCVPGAAWASIVELARERASDLIVMGTHGRSGLRHPLIGSVAERVVRHADCPVLVVRAVKPREAARP